MGIEITNKTDTTITFYVSVVDGYAFYRWWYRPTSTSVAESGQLDGVTEDFSVTLEGLIPDTEYMIRVIYWETSPTIDGSDNYISMDPVTVSTLSPPPTRPDDWAWTGVAVGYYIPTYDGDLAPVTADDWNRFCSRINEFRLYKDMTEYAFTPVSQGEGFSAAPIEQAISAISGISGAGSVPAAIEPLKASFWLQLASALNAVE